MMKFSIKFDTVDKTGYCTTHHSYVEEYEDLSHAIEDVMYQLEKITGNKYDIIELNPWNNNGYYTLIYGFKSQFNDYYYNNHRDKPKLGTVKIVELSI